MFLDDKPEGICKYYDSLTKNKAPKLMKESSNKKVNLELVKNMAK